MTSSVRALSVLDLVSVRSDQTTADALAVSRRTAQLADELGYTRYWVAEHHNMPAIASSNPPVVIAMLAAATSRIRVGSGGMMLPNHQPLVVAEQFALLEAAYPGRIDLGIGRAPGSDPVTSYMLRAGLDPSRDPAEVFPDDLSTTIELMTPEGVGLALRGQRYELRATPRPASVPDVWLLGSSMYSARLAAARGLPYVFAHHFSGQGTAEAVATYRSEFVPSEALAEPRTFVTVNAAAAETAEEAERLVRSQLLMMLRLRTGQPLTAGLLVEDAEQVVVPAEHQPLVDAMRNRWAVGTAADVAAHVSALAEELDVDEVMVSQVASEHRGTAPDESPAREESLRLLAKELLAA